MLIRVSILGSFTALAALTAAAPAAAPSPKHSWSLDRPAWQGAKVASRPGGLKAELPREPAFAGDGRWKLAGEGGIAIEGVDPKRLPSRSLSAEAEVVIDAGQAWGGIYSFAQDNGDYERGWLLGYNESKFVFWVSTGGAMVEVRSKAGFETGRVYHLVGTFDGKSVRLYIDGVLEGERAAVGEIAYPDAAYYAIGGYRDDDENFPMRGELRSVHLYGEALTPAMVVTRARERGVDVSPDAALPPDLEFAVRPALQFVSPTSARVTWESTAPGGSAVAFGRTRRLGEVARSEKAGGEHSVLLEDLEPGATYYYKVGWTSRGRKKFSPVFEFTTATNFTRPPVPGGGGGGPVADTAAQVLERTGVCKGYALVFGAAERELALELVRASDLNVVLAEADPAEVAGARRYLYERGAHGARATVLHTGGVAGVLPLTSGMVNLLVSRREIPPAEVGRLLVPGRGKAYFLEDGSLVEQPRGEGSGDWTHQYGDAANSAASGEQLSGATASGQFALAWVGRPGADFGIDRQPRMPAPLSADGRLFHQGMNRLVALDAHNGAVLWGLEVPDLRRINLPRDCSNWCADGERLFVAVRDRAWVLEAGTGRRLRTLAVVPRPGQGGGDFHWGYIAREGRMLIGSGVRSEAFYRDFWTSAQWFDGKAGSEGAKKVCSDSLFGYALDRASTGPVWTYRDGLIINPTITAYEGRVYFIETRNRSLADSPGRRLSGAALWQDQFLVALDAATGDKVWERPLDTEDGTVAVYLQAAAGQLLASVSNTQYHLYCFDAASGDPVWQTSVAWPDDHHSGHIQHPVITAGVVYLQPNGIDMGTGEIVTTKVGARSGCHTYVGAGGALLYRGGGRMVSLWDRETETVTNWSRLRPSCWLSTIPASGMLLMPEAGGGCSCGSWMETSVGFIPRVRLGDVVGRGEQP